MEFQLRQATPQDAATAVPLIYSSGPAAFEYAFIDGKCRSSFEFLHTAFQKRGSVFSHTNHTVATHDDQVVGVGTCYSAADSFAFMTAVIPQALSFYGVVRGVRLFRRGMQLDRLFRLPDRKKDYIGHLGVLSEWQNHGIGRSLVESFLETGRKAKQTHAALDVSVENPRAQALYERIGFETTAETPSSLPGIPAHRRMQITL